jgi:hypothetical protein
VSGALHRRLPPARRPWLAEGFPATGGGLALPALAVLAALGAGAVRAAAGGKGQQR